jgi:vitamin B12 transporter
MRLTFDRLELRVLASSAMLLVSTARGGFAQRPDSTTRRDSSRAQPLPAVVVTGSFATSPASRLGVAREVVDRAALNAEPARAAVEPLRHMTGVHIDESDGPMGPTIIRVRGGDETFTQILFDGVQGNENGGFFDWQGVTLVNVDRVEVARGPQSTVYGTSAMTGAVQILTREGVPGPMHTELSAEGARTSPLGGSRRSTLETEGGTDLFRYSAGLGAAFDRGQFAVPQNLHSNDASLRLDLVPSGTFQLTGTARYMEALSNLPVRDPGATRAPLDPNQHQGRDRILASVDATWSPSARWTNKLTVSEYHLLFSYDDTKDPIDTTLYPFYIFNDNYHQLSWLQRATARYVGTVTGQPAPSTSLALSYGAELERENLATEAGGDFGPSNLTYSRPSRAVFAEGDLRLGDRLSLVGGGRAESFQGIGAAVVPRATVVFELIPHRLALRGAAAGAYKAPNVQYQFPDPGLFAGNPNLRAETSRSGEVGVDLTGERYTASATVFHQTFGNLIRQVQFDMTGKQIYENIGRSKASGLELDGQVNLRPRWTVGADAAWTSTTVLDNSGLTSTDYPDGQPLPFRPAYNASAFVSAPVTSAFSILVRASAVGRQTVLSERYSGSRVSVDPYHVISGTATYRISPLLETYLHVENALDAEYDTAYDKPGAPRVLALGVRVRR